MSFKGEPWHKLEARLRRSKKGLKVHAWNIYWKMEVTCYPEAIVKWIREQEIPRIEEEATRVPRM